MTTIRPENSRLKGREAILFAALLLSDTLLKVFFSASHKAYCNANGPWGVNADADLFVVVSCMALISVVGVGYLLRDVIPRLAFILIFAGGTGNILDRLLYGCVRDYSLIHWFPAFNAADVMLTIGTVLFVRSIFEKSGRKGV